MKQIHRLKERGLVFKRSHIYWKDLGKLSLRNEKYEEAREYLEKSIQLNTTKDLMTYHILDTVHNYAIVLDKLKEYQKASEIYKWALKIYNHVLKFLFFC